MGTNSCSVAQQVDYWPTACIDDATRRFGGDLLSVARAQARQAWESLPFPNPRIEEWKYTNLDQLLSARFELSKPVASVSVQDHDIRAHVFEESCCGRFVFVDGRFDAALSKIDTLPKGIVVRRTAATPDDVTKQLSALVGFSSSHTSNAFSALNLALTADVLLVKVEERAHISTPIHVLHIATPRAKSAVLSPRLLVECAEGSSASMVESFVSLTDDVYFTNSATEILIGPRATFHVHRFQQESKNAIHISHSALRKSENSSGNIYLYSFGGKLVRNDVDVVFNGEHATGTVNGLTVICGEQHVDNATIIDHAKPHCKSSELFKGIYSDQARGVFGGTIIVRPDAQKTNAYQSNQTLLLSDRASIDTRPQLKIWADDVKCTHGATIGQIDERAMKYLRARGLDEATARHFLVHAFASALTTEIPWEPVREYVERAITDKLEMRTSIQ